VNVSLFTKPGRYGGCEVATLETPEGKTVNYLRRRFIPPPSRFALLQEHLITEHERLDNLAAQYFGDPEQFWLICDANRAMRPKDLTAPDRVGKTLRITLPEGIPAPRVE